MKQRELGKLGSLHSFLEHDLPLKILYLDSETTWTKKTSRCRIDYQKALAQHPSLTMITDGPGFPGFIDAPNSVAKHNPDMIMCFRPLGIPGLDLVNLPKVWSLNETDKHKQLSDESIKYGINHHIFHHPGQINDLAQHLGPEHHYVGILHAVASMYNGDPSGHKDIDILINGCLSQEIYPFRNRLSKLFKKPQFSDLKVHHYNHPGYRIPGVEEQRLMYVDYLKRSKLIIGCTSIYKYPLFKHIEAAACGALTLSDIPLFPAEMYRDICIELKPEWSDAKIEAEVRLWLYNTNDRIRKAEKAQSIILSTRTTKDYANEFVAALNSWGFKC